MIKDILQLTELFLHAEKMLPEEKTWCEFHEEIWKEAPKNTIWLLSDSELKEECKSALIIDINTEEKCFNVENMVSIESDSYVAKGNLFWRASGGSRSDNIRNTPHFMCDRKSDFNVNKIISPLQTIIDDYCPRQKTEEEFSLPLFLSKFLVTSEEKPDSSETYLNSIRGEVEKIKIIINMLKNNDHAMPLQKNVSEKLGDSKDVFIAIKIDGRPLSDFEIFRRYLLFVRQRAGIKGGATEFRNKSYDEIIKNYMGNCPACEKHNILLNQWTTTAELSFYQRQDESRLSFEHNLKYPKSSASFSLCYSCADLLFIFKQRLLKSFGRYIGGNECLVLPSIKWTPKKEYERRSLYNSLKHILESNNDLLLHRLGRLGSYATVSFIFGDSVISGGSQNVRRLDILNIVFPDILPSRLAHIANVINKTNDRLFELWGLRNNGFQCRWGIKGDISIIKSLFFPYWEEKKKKGKSKRRPESEQYLKSIFYGHYIPYHDVADTCYTNLLASGKKTKTAKQADPNWVRYAVHNYSGDLLSFFVFIEELNKSIEGGNIQVGKKAFNFKQMPKLGEFVMKHPILKDEQYLAPFFVGCLFSYAEFLQRDNSRPSAYNWLGTMMLTYDDILQGVYRNVLKYIISKEKIITSPRLQEIMNAVARYDTGGCSNDRLALVVFCHGWSVGRDFILQISLVKKVENKLKDLKINENNDIKEFIKKNKKALNDQDQASLNNLLKLVPEDKKQEISGLWNVNKANGGNDDE